MFEVWGWNRTTVESFADPRLSHSATLPFKTSRLITGLFI